MIFPIAPGKEQRRPFATRDGRSAVEPEQARTLNDREGGQHGGGDEDIATTGGVERRTGECLKRTAARRRRQR